LNKLRALATEIVPLKLRIEEEEIEIDQLKIQFSHVDGLTQSRESAKVIKQQNLLVELVAIAEYH
jgi:hypothetical protein